MQRRSRCRFINLRLFSDVGDSDVSTSKVQAGEQAQKKYSPHTITKNRPRPDRSGVCTMSAPCGTGGFGGRLTPFGCFEYLAGAKVHKLNYSGIIHMEPLRHPSFGKFKIQMLAVFVPNSRIWANADKFAAQKQSLVPSSVPLSVPFISLPFVNTVAVPNPNSYHFVQTIVPDADAATHAPVPTQWYQHSTYRESIMYAYYGRMSPISSYVFPAETNGGNLYTQMQFNVLPVRGYHAAINDCFIDRTTQTPYPEWNSDSVSPAETYYLFTPNNSNDTTPSAAPTANNINQGCMLKRASTMKHYWNDYRTTVYKNNSPVDNTTLFTHNVTQQMIDEYRLQSQNEDLTDQEIIAQLRGVKVPNENVCRIVGQRTIDIDISLQPQTSEGTLSLGADGALSYTFMDVDFLDNTFESNRDGYLHYFWHVLSSDDGMEPEGHNIEMFKTSWSSFYRPSLEAIKDTPLYLRELTHMLTPSDVNRIYGFRSAFAEYFRHPKYIRGDFNAFRVSLTPVGNFLQGSRNDDTGFLSGTSVQDPGGYKTYILPSRNDWHDLRPSNTVSGSAILPPKVNYSDYAIHRLLLSRGALPSDPQYRTLEVAQSLCPFTFSIYGSVTAVVDQPISSRIKRQFIPFGED